MTRFISTDCWPSSIIHDLLPPWMNYCVNNVVQVSRGRHSGLQPFVPAREQSTAHVMGRKRCVAPAPSGFVRHAEEHINASEDARL